MGISVLSHIFPASSSGIRVPHLPDIIKVQPQHRPDGHTQRRSSCQSRNTNALKRGFVHMAKAVWSHGLTPANDDVPVEVSFLGEKGLHQ